jgi:hypothetical protein
MIAVGIVVFGFGVIACADPEGRGGKYATLVPLGAAIAAVGMMIGLWDMATWILAHV